MKGLLITTLLGLLFIINQHQVGADMVQTDLDPYTYYEDLDFVQVELGMHHSAAITSEGRIFTWGLNGRGQLGDGTTTDKSTPTEITSQFNLTTEETILSISLGSYHSAVITSEGRLFTWGNNNFGELGDGTTIDKTSPIEVTSQFTLFPGETIQSISLGSSHSSALTSEGRIFTWGYNGRGQLGDGTSTNNSTPTEITSQFNLTTEETILSISLGSYHSQAITSKGRIFTWGYNLYGQLGDGTTTDKSTPTEITSQFNLTTEETILSISLGSYHSQAITSKGRIFTWGSNFYGQLGDGTTIDKTSPIEVTSQFNLTTEETILSISLGFNHSQAITSKGRLFTWGNNGHGQLGDGTTTDKSTPTEITSQFNLTTEETIQSVSLSYWHSSAITTEGRLFTWGNNDYGQLGDGTTTDKSTPIMFSYNMLSILNNTLPVSETIEEVSSGYFYSSAITSEGRVFTWGYNNYGQLGDGTTIDKTSPTEITSQFNLTTGETILSISLGSSHSAAITTEGRLFTWGSNGNGQLGDGTTTHKSTPTEITSQFDLTTGETIQFVSLGVYHSAAITSEGRLFTWGYNFPGQLGDGTTTSKYTPTEITSQFNLTTGETIQSVSLGNYHSAAITTEGRLFTWGNNDFGELGDGTTIDKTSPIEVTSQFTLFPGEKIHSVSLGSSHSSAITTEGRLFTWGNNDYGGLGDGTTIDKTSPIEVTSQFNLTTEETILSISLDSYQSAAITSEGRLFTWGYNGHGQLGDGTTIDKSTPTEITSQFNLTTEETIQSVSLSYWHSSAITTEGRLFTWGNNDYGQLGDGTTIDKTSPIEITKMYNMYNSTLLTYIEEKQNHQLQNIILSIFPEYKIIDTISSININGNEYANIINKDGRIDVKILNIWNKGDTIDFHVNSITFENGIVMNITGNTTSQATLVEDSWAPEICFDYAQDFIIEKNLGDESYLFAQAVDDTGETLDYTIEGNVDWVIPGTYNLIYTATDLAGNTTKESRVIKVMPKIIEEGQQYQDYTFYYFLDDLIDETLDLSNLIVRYKNQNYSSISDITDMKYINGKNVILFEFLINETTIIVSKDIYLEGSDDIPPTFDTIEDQLIEMGVEDIDWTEYIINADDNVTYGRLTKVEFSDQVDYQNQGTYYVTVKLIDEFGNEAIQEFMVTVQDTTAPSFDFIPNQIIESGQDDFDWTTFVKNLEDNSFQDIIVEEKVDTVDYNTPGEYTVTVTASDVYGNIKEHTFTVYVQDTTAPTVNMETSYTIEAANQDIDWTKEVISFTDNSDGLIYAEELNDLVSYDTPGSYVVTIFVYDSYGNENTQEIEVNIVDATAPTINGVSDYEYVLGTNLPDYLAGITATDIVDGDLTHDVTVNDSEVLYDQVGKYPVVYQVTDSNGNTAEETIEVFVRELVPPVITLSGDERETVELGEDYVQVGGTCTDNYDDVCVVTIEGVVDTSQVGEYTTVYTATDESENTTTITRTVNVVDTTAPELSLNPMDTTVPINAVLEETGVTINDLSTTTMIIDSDLDLTSVGQYTITYTVTDSSGNVSIIERSIHVYEPKPEIQFYLEDALTTIEVGSTYEDPGCTVTIDGESFNCSVEEDTVDTGIAGVYTITYAVEYNGETYTYDRYVFVYELDEGNQVLYYRKEQEEGVIL